MAKTFEITLVARPTAAESINRDFSREFPNSYGLVFALDAATSPIAKHNDQFLIPCTQSSKPSIGWGGIRFVTLDLQISSNVDTLKAMLQWIYSNRLRFNRIDGWNVASQLGLPCKPQQTGFRRGRPHFRKDNESLKPRSSSVKVDNPLLAISTLWGRRDLFQAWDLYRVRPTLETWKDIRSLIVPEAQDVGLTIWQRVEAVSFMLDTTSPGAPERYAERTPEPFLVYSAILADKNDVRRSIIRMAKKAAK